MRHIDPIQSTAPGHSGCPASTRSHLTLLGQARDKARRAETGANYLI